MRFAILLLLLSGCQSELAPEAEAPAGTPMACAVAGAADFSEACTVSRSRQGEEVVLTIVAPDGGFRRVSVAADGAAVTAADGAEPALVRNGPEGAIEFSIAQDRYRLPAAGP